MHELMLQLQLGQGLDALLLSILPSTSWINADVNSLIQQRNQFVCKQLVTMVKEQTSRVITAAAVGDATTMHTARFMFLATLASPASTKVLAAGLFYPRACSKDGKDCPHMYVELLCCNSPGKGLGSLLLQQIEHFVASNSEAISSCFFHHTKGVAEQPAEQAQPVQQCRAAGIIDLCPCTQQTSGIAAQHKSVSSLPVVLPDGHSAQGAPAQLPAQEAVLVSEQDTPTSSTATSCSFSKQGVHNSSGTSNNSARPNSTAGTGSPLYTLTAVQPPATAPPSSVLESLQDCAACSCIRSSAAAAGIYSASHDGCQAALSFKNCRWIRGIKLLSVQSAQGFYSKCGYGPPDSCNEMFKPMTSCSSASKSFAGAVWSAQQAF